MVRPYRRSVFIFALVFALVGGLFLPTFEVFKGTISLGYAPLWWSYMAVAFPEYSPLPFIGIILAHWIGALVVAWLVDRLLNVVISKRG